MRPYLLEQVQFFKIESPLLAYAKNVTSQCGEDGIIERLFTILSPSNRYCIEFGGWDGKHLSNCYNLIANHGWSGCFIEANEGKFAELLANHGGNDRVSCVQRFVEFSGLNSLDNILASVRAPQSPDLMSIDVDGIDYFIWESLEAYTPNVVVIEFNPSIPNDIVFVQPKDNAINQGCSLLALIQLGKRKGYELVACTDINAFFVKTSLYSRFNLTTNAIQHMYRPLMDGRIFHGYDSYVYVTGMPYLIWSEVPVTNEDVQVLPRDKRTFEDAQSKA